MIKEEKWLQFGMPRTNEDIKGITIHNSGNYNMSAEQLFNYLENESTDTRACHYIVDDKQVIQVMPHDYAVWHTGKAYDFGNMKTIAIEIVSQRNEDTYLQGQDKAIELIKQLMEQYHLTRDDIFFHRDFDEYINCPANILQMYKTKKEFLDEFF